MFGSCKGKITAMTRVIKIFSYGSNMLLKRINRRCPSARSIGVGELCGYRLTWSKRSKDNSGKCDIEKTEEKGAIVYGVIYEIAANEKKALDKEEGLGKGYDEMQVEVILGGAPTIVSTYYATAIDANLKPYSWYKALVLAGAREHILPLHYIENLEEIEAIEDENRKRHDQHMKFTQCQPLK